MNRPLIEIVWDWGVRCFGRDHMSDPRIRSLRFIEEATELAQSLNVPKEAVDKVIEAVYNRPVGKTYQEVGGSLVTLYVLCWQMGIDPERCLLDETKRCLSKSPEHFARRNQEKLDLGLK